LITCVYNTRFAPWFQLRGNMGKGGAGAGDSALRRIPAVERVLSSAAFQPVIDRLGRLRVKDALVAHLDALRSSRRAFDETSAVEAVTKALDQVSLRTVVNATGVIIHTNLGRSPIGDGIWRRAAGLVESYANLEFDVSTGERGRRDDHLQSVCASLFGCEAAILTNNNAAAVLLLLSAVARDREVLVSRGELVEIGGSFRVPDVIQQGGARLREVGTTNRTRARDYSGHADAAAILRVHRSNFEIVGFTETPSMEEIVAVKGELPLLYDEGSGRVVDLAKYGFTRHDTIREVLRKGVDVLTCSTDKLIGATQGGLILGRAGIIDKCRKHPLMRALRAGKESYAVIGETLGAFAAERHESEIPIYRMLAAPVEELRRRGEDIVRGTKCTIVDSECALGGGTTPTETIRSLAVEVPGNANELYDRFLSNATPVAGRIANDRFTLDLRTILPDEGSIVAGCLRTASG
jgi:L-seryl-tRNA(Ser) seleniumtransferase